MVTTLPALRPRVAGGGVVRFLPPDTWVLHLPATERGYVLAQLDDYAALPRRAFPWKPPLHLVLQARVEPAAPPGTWGFGFWNDPWAFLGGAGRRLPTGPQALWFFGASRPNWLSLHPEVPPHGFFAGVTRWQAPALALYLVGLLGPLLWLPRARERIRNQVARWMAQWGVALEPPTQWQTFEILWEPHRVTFRQQGETVGTTPLVPRAPLGLVIWVDNQFAAWEPRRGPRWGTLPLPQPTTLWVRGVQVFPGEPKPAP